LPYAEVTSLLSRTENFVSTPSPGLGFHASKFYWAANKEVSIISVVGDVRKQLMVFLEILGCHRFSFRLPGKPLVPPDIRNSNSGHWKKVLDRLSGF
jgi:hypothetical protein